MIGKLEPRQKREWPNHLAVLTHAYNSTRSAITRFNPHYLMFSHWPHLPIDLFPCEPDDGKDKASQCIHVKIGNNLEEHFQGHQRSHTRGCGPPKKTV